MGLPSKKTLGRLFMLTTMATLLHVGNASPASAAGMSLGADGAFAVPLSTWGDVSSVGIGALLRFEVDLTENFTVTGRIGFIFHFDKQQATTATNTSELPILGGVKYYILGESNGFYAAAEVGLVNIWGYTSGQVEGVLIEGSDSELNLGLTLGVGYTHEAIDARVCLIFPDIGELDDAIGILLTVGYDFVSF